MMLQLAIDWATISSLATAAGTLVLALATFASVRSSSRSARIAEAALQEQRRPVLAPSRPDDPVQKLMFVEGRWLSAAGGRGAAEHVDGNVPRDQLEERRRRNRSVPGLGGQARLRLDAEYADARPGREVPPTYA